MSLTGIMRNTPINIRSDSDTSRNGTKFVPFFFVSRIDFPALEMYDNSVINNIIINQERM